MVEGGTNIENYNTEEDFVLYIDGVKVKAESFVLEYSDYKALSCGDIMKPRRIIARIDIEK